MYQVTIKVLVEQPTAVIRVLTDMSSINDTFDDIMPAAWAAVQQSDRTAVGPPFTRYFRFDDEAVDLEGGLPVDAPFIESGRVVPSSLPGGEAASLDHFGSYDSLGAAHVALDQWLVDEGRQAAGPVWEVYWTDPSAETDQAKWRTELLVPLAPEPAS